MKYGKIRIEDGYLIFTKHMMINSLPCKDILWAYMRREGTEGGGSKQLIVNYLMIVTRQRKRYKFDMTEKEVKECISLLKALNPDIALGYPKGGKISAQSMPNIRDLGALYTEDGRHILPRRLLRSGDLYHISVADQDTLHWEYHLSAVIDLRTPAERDRKPDATIPYVRYYHIPIMEEETYTLAAFPTPEEFILNFRDDPDEYMIRLYENFIRDQFSVKQFALFLDRILRQEEGAVLWHSSSGKDRAGVGTALLLCVLGVSKEDIIEDFVKSNTYLEGEMEYMIRFMESRTIVDARTMDNIRLLHKVKPEYLEAVFSAIEKYYGTVDRFLRRALYLTPKAIEDLKSRYLI